MRVSIAIIFIALFLVQCAQVKAPTGGPKDEDPPRDSLSFPSNFSTNFQTKHVTVRFTEYIKLNNINQKLLVSPIMPEDPDISVKGKKLNITLPDSLAPNTTYTINFSDAIEDITEGNAMENYSYVFSTGSVLDSLSITGMVVNAETPQPEEGVFVMLYQETNDSVPIKQKPFYLAKTDKTGKFRLKHLAAGIYKCFALRDNNSNYLFDLPNEEIAFVDTLVELTSNISSMELRLFKEDHTKQYLISHNASQYGRLQFVYNKRVSDFKVNPLNASFKKDWYIEETSDGGDTINLWLSGLQGIDTLLLTACDDTICDTLEFDLQDEKVLEKRKLALATNALMHSFPFYSKISFRSDAPVVAIDDSLITILEDSVSMKTALIQQDTTLREMKIQHQLKENTRYDLMIYPGAFLDLFGKTTDTLKYSFVTTKKEDYGKVSVKIMADDSVPCRIDLKMEDHIVRSIWTSTGEEVVFDHITPGKYNFSLLLDTDNNMKWSAGNYIEHRQPEMVVKYKTELQVKGNWDQTIEWNITSIVDQL